jgi:tetratricopeptide (TPR) repeat protein
LRTFFSLTSLVIRSSPLTSNTPGLRNSTRWFVCPSNSGRLKLETHLLKAEHLYRGYLDYKGARAEVELARRTLPNDPLVFELAGFIDRRQGRWGDSTRNFEQEIERDPRNVYILQQIALSHQLLRRYPEMAAVLDRALAITPADVDTRVRRAEIEFDKNANPRPLHDTIDAILAENPASAPTLADAWLLLALCQRDTAAAERAMVALNNNAVRIDALLLNRAVIEGLVARVRGDAAAARQAFLAARAQQQQAVDAQPDYGPAVCILGLIDAGLENKEDALREGQRAMELLPVERDAINGPHIVEFFSIICAWIGENDLAFEYLERATRLPGWFNYGHLKLHPCWDPIRKDPRFEQIVASLAPTR